MSETLSIAELNSLLREGKPFAAFRLPGQKDFHFAGEEGFVVKVVEYCQKFQTASNAVDFIPRKGHSSEEQFITTPKNEYLAGVNEVVRFHKSLGFGKTVLARQIAGVTHIETVLDRVSNYFATQPNAFCLVWFTPDGLLRVMATPELLLKIDSQNRLTTMALAGTRHVGLHTEWDEKNLEEHKIVAEYIRERLADLGYCNPRETKYTRQSGNIEHICTEFVAEVKGSESAERLEEAGRILDALSPTPAVCGYPVESARGNIRKYEKVKRDFYSGYTVVIMPSGEIYAFVNLRFVCIDIKSGKFAITSGSGVTALSDAEVEWEETALKAQPLLTLLSIN